MSQNMNTRSTESDLNTESTESDLNTESTGNTESDLNTGSTQGPIDVNILFSFHKDEENVQIEQYTNGLNITINVPICYIKDSNSMFVNIGALDFISKFGMYDYENESIIKPMMESLETVISEYLGVTDSLVPIENEDSVFTVCGIEMELNDTNSGEIINHEQIFFCVEFDCTPELLERNKERVKFFDTVSDAIINLPDE